MDRRSFFKSLGGVVALAALPAVLLAPPRAAAEAPDLMLVGQNYSDIIATTIAKHSDAIRDNVIRNNALLKLMEKRIKEAEASMCNAIAHDLYTGAPYESEEVQSNPSLSATDFWHREHSVRLPYPSHKEISALWSTV